MAVNIFEQPSPSVAKDQSSTIVKHSNFAIPYLMYHVPHVHTFVRYVRLYVSTAFMLYVQTHHKVL